MLLAAYFINTFFMKMRTIAIVATLLSVDAFLASSRNCAPKVSKSFDPLRTSESSTALQVWWFGGTESSEVNGDDDSCELVAVRIERTSPNSRRIAGDITVPGRLDDVWSILTDYDRLSIHVPNLMESKIRYRNSGGEPGDGQFRCRLYQVGAQKIIGFDFSASVTMDMTEKIIQRASSSDQFAPQERMIGFKCVDSQFFTEFDGDWRVKEEIGPLGEIETKVSYVVDVRPKGPVPVAALEWRIREDVPTNLRAVKAATLSKRDRQLPPVNDGKAVLSVRDVNSIRSQKRQERKFLVPILGSDWDRDETMAKYL